MKSAFLPPPMHHAPINPAAVALIALCLAPVARGEVGRDYLRLVERYARGQRAPAVAGLSGFTEADLSRNVQLVEAAVLGRSGEPQAWLTAGWLRAAVMLHVDRDAAERSTAWADREQRRPCPGPHARHAGRYAGLLAQWPETRGFARRFFLAMAARCQWDACFAEAQDWSREGLKLFPRDAELLFTTGSTLEEDATLRPEPTLAPADPQPRARELAVDRAVGRQFQFEASRRFYEEALSADASLVVVRVHLGRVLWRLKDGSAARAALEQAFRDTRQPDLLYLAHLFLGRIHEDASRLEDATTEYRLALALDPKAQAAAIALSHALRLGGEVEESRQLVVRALGHAGRRDGRDLYWEYIAGNSIHVEELLAGLRTETLQ